MPVREMPSVLPMQSRRAPISSGAINAETRTVTVTFSTGAAVRRRRWTGWDSSVPFDEVLTISERAVNMERLNAGAPALDSHSAYSSYSQVGVVQRAWIEGGEARAEIRFPRAGIDEAADRMFGLVAEGIIRNVSVGYTIDEARVIEAEKKGEVERRIVERWTPMEISFVTIPADAGAQVRSADGDQPSRATYPTIINRASAPIREESAMTDHDTRSAAAEPAQNTTSAAPAADAIRAERERCAAINDIGTRAGLPAADIAAAVSDGTAVEAFRARAFEALAGRQQAATHVVVQGDETEKRRAAMEEAVIRSMSPAAMPGEWSPAAAQYRGMGLVSLAEARLGERRSGDSLAAREDILRRAMHSTSDFPILLENAMNRTVAARYALAQPTYRQFSVRQDFNDFRPHISVTAGDFPMLEKTGEGGAIKFGTIGEKKEQVAVASYSQGVSISRQVLVNDTLGALDDVLAGYGQTVALMEEKVAYAVLAENSADGPTLLEGAAAMFTTTRTNKAGTATAINEAGVAAGRAAMRKYKSIDGNVLLYNAPGIILCSPDKETEAEKFVSTVVAAQTANVNPFAGKLRVVVSAMLSGNRWWLFCEPTVRANFRWGLLTGYAAPRVRVDEPFGSQGMAMTVEHDFGFGGIDWRAGYVNAGA